MPPPITSGLLWSTDVAIEFAASGPVVPAIPMPRAAGPLYCVVSAQTAGSEGVIFRVGNPDDNFHVQNTFQAERWDGLYGLMAAPGWPNQVIGEAPAISVTADHLWEFWFSAAGTDFIDHQPFGFVNNDLPDQDVAASSHLFVGYRPNEGSPMDRAAGTIHRMAIFDRVPTPAERAQLVEWVQSQGAPPITAALAASDAPDTARIIASVRWPAIMGRLAAANAPDTAAVSVAVPIRAALATIDPPDTAAIRIGTGWPAISARLAARGAPDRAAVVGAVSIRGVLAAADTPDLAQITAGTGWPAIMARVAASDAPDRAAFHAAVPIRARLAASDAPDGSRLSVAVRIGAVLDAADAPDMARIIMRLWSQSSRYAYPGDPQGGVLGPSARGGVLAPSIRSGTIQRP